MLTKTTHTHTRKASTHTTAAAFLSPSDNMPSYRTVSYHSVPYPAPTCGEGPLGAAFLGAGAGFGFGLGAGAAAFGAAGATAGGGGGGAGAATFSTAGAFFGSTLGAGAGAGDLGSTLGAGAGGGTIGSILGAGAGAGAGSALGTGAGAGGAFFSTLGAGAGAAALTAGAGAGAGAGADGLSRAVLYCHRTVWLEQGGEARTVQFRAGGGGSTCFARDVAPGSKVPYRKKKNDKKGLR